MFAAHLRKSNSDLCVMSNFFNRYVLPYLPDAAIEFLALVAGETLFVLMRLVRRSHSSFSAGVIESIAKSIAAPGRWLLM